MTDFIETHEIGTKPITLGVDLSLKDLATLFKEEGGRIFQLTHAQMLPDEPPRLTFTPSRGGIYVHDPESVEGNSVEGNNIDDLSDDVISDDFDPSLSKHQ